jgi:fructose-1,6-bisphosphatase I
MSLKDEKNPYKHRYVGSMVADIHRTLLKGGIFLYPTDKNSPKGKLRLMLEVNPLALLIERAGGASLSGAKSPLRITPKNHTQSVPIVMGSKQEVERYQSFIM